MRMSPLAAELLVGCCWLNFQHLWSSLLNSKIIFSLVSKTKDDSSIFLSQLLAVLSVAEILMGYIFHLGPSFHSKQTPLQESAFGLKLVQVFNEKEYWSRFQLYKLNLMTCFNNSNRTYRARRGLCRMEMDDIHQASSYHLHILVFIFIKLLKLHMCKHQI